MSLVYLILGALLSLLARAGVRRPRRGRPLWVVGMGIGELGGWFLALSLLLLGGSFVNAPPGVVTTTARILLALSSVGFGGVVVRGFRSVAVARDRLGDRLEALSAPWWRVRAVLWPVVRAPRGVVTETHKYGPHARHLVDVISSAGEGRARPVLIHIHGGGWWRGKRSTQARPLVYEMARRGWAVFTPSYRLSPEATFPDHLVDVKRVIAWIRGNATELGVDAGFVAVAGGSTGGNLAALAALTAGRRGLQPGFEDVDTSVQACVPLYGIHDLITDAGEALWPYLERDVMKSSPRSDPDSWRLASPVRVSSSARPPFLVVHGSADTLVRPEQSRRLVTALIEAGGPPVLYLEVPHGNHGFDFFAGPRGAVTVAAVASMLEGARAGSPVEEG